MNRTIHFTARAGLIDASEGCEAWSDEGEPGGRHRARGATLGYSVPVPPPSRPG